MPPAPTRCTMRYRPATIFPGKKRPRRSDSDGCGSDASAVRSLSSSCAPPASDSDRPQVGQNRLSSGTGLEQPGQTLISGSGAKVVLAELLVERRLADLEHVGELGTSRVRVAAQRLLEPGLLCVLEQRGEPGLQVARLAGAGRGRAAAVQQPSEVLRLDRSSRLVQRQP